MTDAQDETDRKRCWDRALQEACTVMRETEALDVIHRALEHGADFCTTGRNTDTLLHMAIETGKSLPFVKLIASAPGIDLNAVNKAGMTPFLSACQRKDLDLVRYLATLQGVDLKATDKSGFNALHVAVNVGGLCLVQFLLSPEFGFSVECRTTGRGMTSLHIACLYGHLRIAKYLLNAQAADLKAFDNNGAACFHLAVASGHSKVVRCLLTTYPQAQFVSKTDKHGSAPLEYICAHYDRDGNNNHNGHLEVTRLLLENGAQVNRLAVSGCSPLYRVAARGFPLEIVREFVQHGADLRAVTDLGHTAWDAAYRHDESDVADYLLTEAYKDQMVDQEGTRAVHAILEVAVYRYLEADDSGNQRNLQVRLPIGRLTVDKFRSLLQCFDTGLMRQQDSNGTLPFHVACRGGAPVEILRLVLEEYPDAQNVADNRGYFPIHYACQAVAPSLDVIRFLSEQHPASVFAQTSSGALALHLLCGAKPADNVVRFLLQLYEGSISVTTNDGDLPLMVACKTRASESVVQLLLRGYPDALEYMFGLYNPEVR